MNLEQQEQTHDKLISMEEFAELLGIKPDTLYRKFRKNPALFPKPVCSAILGQKRFLLSEVWVWIKEQA